MTERFFKIKVNTPFSGFKKYQLIIVLVIAFVQPQLLKAQTENTLILSKVLNGNNVLNQNSVNGLYFDNATGFLWIGTEGGLVRYNGITSKIFDTRNVGALSMPRIWNIYPTNDGEIVAMDRLGKVVAIHADSVSNSITADYGIYQSRAEMYLPGIKSGGGKKAMADINALLGSFYAGYFRSAIYMQDSLLFLYAINSFYVYSHRELFQFPIKLKAFGSYALIRSGKGIVALNIDGSGYYFDVANKTYRPIKINKSAFDWRHSQLYYSNANNSACLLNGNSIYKISTSEDSVTTKLVGTLPELPKHIYTVLIHPDNNQVFIGTVDEGLFIYSKTYFKTYSFEEKAKYMGNKDLSRLADINNLYSCTLLDSNHICVSNGAVLNLSDGRFNFTGFGNGYFHPHNSITDGKSNFYFNYARVPPGFARASFSSVGSLQLNATGNFGFWGNTFYYDSLKKQIWVSSYNNIFNFLGIFRGDSLFEYTRLPTNAVQIKRTNGILMVHNAKDIFKIDEVAKKPVKICSFDEPFIRDIYVDRDNNLWIATYGKGIFMYDMSIAKMYHCKGDFKEFLRFSHCFIDDSKGNFFIPTNNGLFHINRQALLSVCKDSTKHLFYHYYSEADGLITNEFNGGCNPAYNIMPNGDLLLPSLRGLVRVYSSAISAPQNYPLFIEKVTTTLRSAVFKENMLFQSSERSITWEVNFAQWNNPNAAGISYRLDNDTAWTYLDATKREILLTDLKGGKHKLQIRNQFDLNGDRMSSLTINFEIRKKYYETLWFWGCVVLCFLLFGVLVSWFRNIRLRKLNTYLSKKIDEKTIEIKNKNIELVENLNMVNEAMDNMEENSKFQQRLIGVLGHDVMIPIQYISKVSGQLLQYKDTLSAETIQDAIGDISSTSSNLFYHGESIIQWIKLQENDFVLHPVNFQLKHEVEQLIGLHKNLSAEKNNTIENNIPDGLFCMQDPVVIRIILHNLITNSNKFTAKGIIAINARKISEGNDDFLELVIKDTGRGISKELIDQINRKEFFKSREGTQKEYGWGFGYRLITDLVHLLEGRFYISSVEGASTTVELKIPLLKEDADA